MAGHSKWHNIKNRKAAVDAKKGQAYGQLAKLIRVAVREGSSGDANTNPHLRLILDKARAVNMPNSNIQRAIDRGLGKSASGAAVQEVVYEAYGPGGVGMLVAAATDNPNRTASEMRFILSRNGGTLGGPGSALFLFQRSAGGETYTPTMPMELEDQAIIQQLENLIEALHENDDVEEVFCAANWPGTEAEAEETT